MDVKKYYKSIHEELTATKERVATAVSHHGEAGAWKEAILRNAMRRHLPASLGVGHGFVLLEDGGTTTQLDIIVYDQSFPKYVQEGEFIIVSADAVRAIVEVKSSTDSSRLSEDLSKLGLAAHRIRAPNEREVRHGGVRKPMWAGYFAFNQGRNVTNATLGAYLRQASEQGMRSAINAACLGPHRFLRHWNNDEVNERGINPGWRAYHLDNQGYGYFITNMLSVVCNESVYFNHSLWFPAEGKGKGTPLN